MTTHYYVSSAGSAVSIPSLVDDDGSATIEDGRVFGSPVKLDFPWLKAAKKSDADGYEPRVYRAAAEVDADAGDIELAVAAEAAANVDGPDDTNTQEA